ncbi:tetratricopeptide repeat protein [Agathobacter rectalis]
MNEQGRDYKLQGMALMGTGNYKDAQRMFKKALEIEDVVSLIGG